MNKLEFFKYGPEDGNKTFNVDQALNQNWNKIIDRDREVQDELAGKEALIKNATVKTGLVDADTLPLSDSAASNGTKRITFANLKAALKVYFDGLYNKYTHPAYTPKAAGLYKVTVDATGHTSAASAVAKTDITALGIPERDTIYTHPNDANTRHVTDAEKITWNAKAGTVAATTTANGLMAAADKVKLDGIAAQANKTIVANNLTTTAAGSALDAAQGKLLNDKVTEVNNQLTAVGKKAVTLIVGLLGTHPASEVDYLADNAVGADVAINAAIQALPAGGGCVLIREGMYEIKSVIRIIKNNVSMCGNGDATVLKRMFSQSNSEYGVIHIPALVSKTLIDRLGIDGNSAVYSGYSNCGISTASGVINDLRIVNVAISKCKSSAIYFSTARAANTTSNIIVSNCLLTNCERGIYGEMQNITVDNCIFSGMEFVGIDVAMNSQYPESKGCIIIGNIFSENISGISDLLGSATMNGPYKKNIIISNNYFIGNRIGVFLKGNISGVISGNLFRKTTFGTDEYTIKLTTGVSNVLIDGNYCLGKSPVIDGATNITNTNNKV